MDAARVSELLRPALGAGGPFYADLVAGLRGLVLDGRLPVGGRLPSERDLAQALGVSRTTVTAAYDVLRADGYLRSRRGAGSTVLLPGRPARPERLSVVAAGLDLTVAALPAPGALTGAVEEAVRLLPPLLAGHGLHPLGLPVLREAVAAHLSGRGLPTTVDQILITNGALHGWDLLLRALTKPGDPVAVEQPTYPAVLDALAAHRLRAVPMPVSLTGWELPHRPPRAALAHVTPDFQNPTGHLATDRARRDLLASLRGAVVVVDETFADLGPCLRPLASYSSDVITLGSMSKAFWAGLRVGWIRARPSMILRLAQVRAGLDLAGPVLDQLVSAVLLGRAEAVLGPRRQMLAASRDALVAALADRLPAWRVPVPTGGMVLWCELPTAVSTRLAALGQRSGVLLTPGPRFAVAGSHDRFLRLPFTGPASGADQVASTLAGLVSELEVAGGRLQPPSRWTA